MYTCGDNKIVSRLILINATATAADCDGHLYSRSQTRFLYVYRFNTYNIIRINTIRLYHRLWFPHSCQPVMQNLILSL